MHSSMLYGGRKFLPPIVQKVHIVYAVEWLRLIARGK